MRAAQVAKLCGANWATRVRANKRYRNRKTEQTVADVRHGVRYVYRLADVLGLDHEFSRKGREEAGRFILKAHERLTGFLELEAAIRAKWGTRASFQRSDASRSGAALA